MEKWCNVFFFNFCCNNYFITYGVISVLALNVQDISANIEDGVRIYVKLERSIDENAEKEVGNQIKKLKVLDLLHIHQKMKS
jgi:cell division protein FtsX